ncbi:type VI secretion system tip protein TssI/VgrG [Shewanella surugensis]|uniref:Type VI secretion system tip protein VgrG n=1 Tax=Shewanella surugensis TaxID=212020 RepID=A0ABT0LCY0_9GAMM|nr:type VI secretion system tip protein TssI/VgrG [Shewanella surugensis]MCL1125534.1 type VI secretion system tip protein VgrG [Shewanella surugensis]
MTVSGSEILTGSGLRYHFSAEGLDETSFDLVDFSFEERLSQPFEVKLSLLSRQSDIDPADVVDLSGLMQWAVNGETQRQVHGVVSRFTKGDTGHHHTQYYLTLVPALSHLKLKHNSRIFQQQSALAIIATLLGDIDITDFAFNCDPSLSERVREYCVQYRETDFDFFNRLAAEEGLFYHFEHTESSHTVVFSDSPLKLTKLGESFPYNALIGGVSDVPFVKQLSFTHKVRPSSVSLKDSSFKQPEYSFLHESLASDLAHQRDTYEHFDFPGRYKSDAAGAPFAQARLDYLRRDAKVGRAKSNIMAASAGYKFDLVEHLETECNRDWLLTCVVHIGVQGAASEETNSTTPTTYNNDFYVIPANSAWQATPTTKPLINGEQIATVVGPEGEEIFCDEFGRVKLQFSWDRYSDGDDLSSGWVRVSQGWAGAQFGMMSVPRIGNQVIVSYFEGDPDQPIITGRSHDAVNTPAYALPEHQTRTVLKTKTHKGEGSNELYFEDEAGEEAIYFHAQKDMNTLVENVQRHVIKHDQHLSVANNRVSLIKGKDHLTIKGESRMQVGKDHSMQVKGSQHQKIAKKYLLEAGKEVHFKSGGKIVIEAGAEVTLKVGASLVKIDPAGVHLVGSAINLNSGGGAGSGSGYGGKAPELPKAVEEAVVAEEVALQLEEASMEMLAIADIPMTSLCQKQLDGSCPLEDCPCLQGA